MYHEDTARAGVFGTDAERYDRARPSYPPALIDDLMAGQPARVLDVGCGTGKAGRLLLDRGCHVVGVEHDARMAAVARGHGLDMEVARFEDWDPSGRQFDLVMAAQAWHWIDPSVGPAKAAAALGPGRRLAVFWNMYHHEPETEAAFDEVYRRVAPEIMRGSAPLGTVGSDGDTRYLDAVTATGEFDPPEVAVYPWAQRYTRDDWIDQLPTHSDHALLPQDKRARLLEGVSGVIDGLGGAITVRYDTTLISARRRG